jgi:hypothetical protein
LRMRVSPDNSDRGGGCTRHHVDPDHTTIGLAGSDRSNVDLTDTGAESTSVRRKVLIGVPVFPRLRVLLDVSGNPALHSVLFGATRDCGGFV